MMIKNLQSGERIESTKPIYIKGGKTTVYNVPVGVGYHWEKTETRIYPESMAFQINGSGKIVVINIVPLETYLKGVVPSEMPDSFPLEALKAQAVAAVHRAEPDPDRRPTVLGRLAPASTAPNEHVCRARFRARIVVTVRADHSGVAADRHVRNLAAIGQMAATLAHEIRGILEKR